MGCCILKIHIEKLKIYKRAMVPRFFVFPEVARTVSEVDRIHSEVNGNESEVTGNGPEMDQKWTGMFPNCLYRPCSYHLVHRSDSAQRIEPVIIFFCFIRIRLVFFITELYHFAKIFSYRQPCIICVTKNTPIPSERKLSVEHYPVSSSVLPTSTPPIS